MKSILMSIHPKWCEKIFSGQKTIEVRKTAPKPPFKVVVYCTKKGNDKLKNQLVQMDDTGELKLCSATNLSAYRLNGKVIGEFVCNEVSEYRCKKNKDGASEFTISEKDFKDMAIDGFDLFDYADGKDLYGIHITDTILYDKPKELGEFRKPDTSCGFYNPDLERCDSGYNCERCVYNDLTITRPPQSWQYVGEVEK